MPSTEPTRAWHRFAVDTVALRGKRLRILTENPLNDAGIPQDQLPERITDVIAADDDVTIYSTVRVHPVDDPDTIAYVRIEQLALYNDQP